MSWTRLLPQPTSCRRQTAPLLEEPPLDVPLTDVVPPSLTYLAHLPAPLKVGVPWIA